MQNYGGISRYFFELMRHSKKNGYTYDLSLLTSSNECLSENNKGFLLLSKGFNGNYYKFTNQINCQYSRIKIKFGKHDVFHPTYFSKYYDFNKAKPYVITVYDLIMEKFPQYFNCNSEFVSNKKSLIENADRVISISENTKRDILDHYNVSESKIEVTYLAESLSNLNSEKINYLPCRYILFVGNREGYKNFINLYKAIKELFKFEKEIFLVCAGGGAFTSEEKKMFSKDSIESKIKYVQFKNNRELKYLYENAALFVFPSFYEGFGIPILESFASGCLTCLSNSSSLKEVGGNAALFFDPSSYEDIKDTIIKALSLEENNKYIASAAKELAKYSWGDTTKNTFNVYKKCC